MKILILGAGAVGGYWGARLHPGRHRRHLPAAREARRAGGRNGLVVKSPKGDVTVPVKVVTKGDEGGPYDVVILACKAYDLDSAMDVDRAGGRARHDHRAHAERPRPFRHARCPLRRGQASPAAWRASRGMLGPNGEILHSGASGVSFGERDGKPARPALVALDAACKKAGIEGGLNPTSTRTSGTSG